MMESSLKDFPFQYSAHKYMLRITLCVNYVFVD